jgi:hypothetical protein
MLSAITCAAHRTQHSARSTAARLAQHGGCSREQAAGQSNWSRGAPPAASPSPYRTLPVSAALTPACPPPSWHCVFCRHVRYAVGLFCLRVRCPLPHSKGSFDTGALQLGTGGTEALTFPTEVGGLTAKSVAAGPFHTLAVTSGACMRASCMLAQGGAGCAQARQAETNKTRNSGKSGDSTRTRRLDETTLVCQAGRQRTCPHCQPQRLDTLPATLCRIASLETCTSHQFENTKNTNFHACAYLYIYIYIYITRGTGSVGRGAQGQ